MLVFVLLAVILTGCNENTAGNDEDIPAPTNNVNAKLSDNETEVSKEKYIPPKMKGEITISTLDTWDFLNEGARMFMDKYPDIKITINAFRNTETVKFADGSQMTGSSSEEFSTENYLSLLNTKIMTGKAEDIIMTIQSRLENISIWVHLKICRFY